MKCFVESSIKRRGAIDRSIEPTSAIGIAYFGRESSRINRVVSVFVVSDGNTCAPAGVGREEIITARTNGSLAPGRRFITRQDRRWERLWTPGAPRRMFPLPSAPQPRF